MRRASWGVVAVLLLAACPASDHDAYTAQQRANAHRAAVEAERFHRESEAEIDRAAAAAAEAERVIAEQQAAAAAEQARQQQAALAAQRAARSRTSTTVRRAPAPRAAPVADGDFWRRLANCESASGQGGNGGGYFQFSPDTARKVGYHAGMSYEQQRALAIKWLGMIGGRGGSRSGWPVCWWKAGGH